MHIEVSAENQKRLSELLTALRDGVVDADGKTLRRPMPIEDLAEKLKVARTTVWSWREDGRFPRSAAVLEDLCAVVGAGDGNFQAYFAGTLSLEELLSLGKIVRPKESLENAWNRFLQLELSDQLQFESRLLMRRAEALETPSQTVGNQKKLATKGKESAILLNALDKSRDNMDEVGSNWSDRELLRAQALLNESLRKRGVKTMETAAKKSGVNLQAVDIGDLELLKNGTLQELRMICFYPGLLDAIATISYKVEKWNDVYPLIGDSTYRNRVEALLRDLANHEHQQA